MWKRERETRVTQKTDLDGVLKKNELIYSWKGVVLVTGRGREGINTSKCTMPF